MSESNKVVGLRGERVNTPPSVDDLLERTPPLKNAVIIGVGHNGLLYTDSTHTTSKDDLWLLRLAEQAIMIDAFDLFGPEYLGDGA